MMCPPAIWEYQATHAGALPDDPGVAPELEAIANSLISNADVNKQVLPQIPRELIECVGAVLIVSWPLDLTHTPPCSGTFRPALGNLSFHLRRALRILATTAAHEISPVCAVVGGLLAQDILKALAAREPPIANFFTFDGNLGSGTVVRMSMP